MTNEVSCDVIVIGAGASGLACAQELARAGKRVIVLEARNRTGGRIHTIRDRGVVEAGAEFVHGENASTWEVIRANQLQIEEWRNESSPHGPHRVFARQGGIRTDTEKLYQEMMETEKGLYEYQGEEISAADFLKQRAISDEALFFAERHIGDLEAADLKNLSTRLLGHEGSLATNGSRNFWITGGYDQVVNALAKEIDVRLSHEVTRVDWQEGGVTVTCANSATLSAPQLVITIPIGVMRATPPKFTPELPASFTNAFKSIGFGNTTKLTVWLDNTQGLPSFRMLDSEGMFGHFWPRLFGPEPVLVGYSGAGRADELTAMGEEAAIAAGIAELADALGNDIKKKILAVRHFTWSDDPYARGSYSYSALNMGNARDDLRTPIANTIFYTGEATNAQGHTATVNGAIEAGRSTGRLLL